MAKKKQTMNNPKQRLRAILGSTERVPRVRLDTLRRFHGHLKAHLSFPFDGKLISPIGPHRDTLSPLSVIRLLDPVEEYEPEEMAGLICKASQKGEQIELPLDRIDVDEMDPHYQLLEDYRFWLTDWQ